MSLNTASEQYLPPLIQEPEFLLDIESERDLERMTGALSDLDDYGGALYDKFDSGHLSDVINVIGVFIGLKPVTEFNRWGLSDLEQKMLKDAVFRLGMHAAHLDLPSGMKSIVISRSPTEGVALIDAFTAMHTSDDVQKDNEHRKIGRLLGFPETAIEHFINRSGSDGAAALESAPRSGSSFHKFALSPENDEAEHVAYSEPLELAVETLLPKTYRAVQLMDKYDKRYDS